MFGWQKLNFDISKMTKWFITNKKRYNLNLNSIYWKNTLDSFRSCISHCKFYSLQFHFYYFTINIYFIIGHCCLNASLAIIVLKIIRLEEKFHETTLKETHCFIKNKNSCTYAQELSLIHDTNEDPQ